MLASMVATRGAIGAGRTSARARHSAHSSLATVVPMAQRRISRSRRSEECSNCATLCATAFVAKCLSQRSDAGGARALAGLHNTEPSCPRPAEYDDDHTATSLLWFQRRLRAVRKLVHGAHRIPQPSVTALSQARVAATLWTASSFRSHAHQVVDAPALLNDQLTRQLHDNLVAAARFRSATCNANLSPHATARLCLRREIFASCICPYCNTSPCNLLHELSLSQPAAAARPSPSRHAPCHAPPPPSASSPLHQYSTTTMTDVDAFPNVARLLDAASRTPNSYSSSRPCRQTSALR